MITFNDVGKIRRRVAEIKNELNENRFSYKVGELGNLFAGLDIAVNIMQNAVNEFVFWLPVGVEDKPDYWECSNCQYKANLNCDTPPDWAFCPNCGAKMNGKIDIKAVET